MLSNSEWISNELLKTILEAENGSSQYAINIFNVDVQAATNKGDNYASEMYRVVIEFGLNGERMKCNRIFKVIPSGEIQRIVMESGNIFPREIAAYRNVLPEINKMLQSVGDSTTISPRCTFTTDEPTTMLVFEDIKQKGYQMIDRRFGLDLDQFFFFLKGTNVPRGTSPSQRRKEGIELEPFMEGSISTNPNRQDFLIFHKLCAQEVVELVESWNDTSISEILCKLRKLPNAIIRKGCEVYTRDENAFNVLNHNDVWTNNMMFKYEKGVAEDVLLFDYQLTYFGSPGVDLNYLLSGSIQTEIEEERRLQIIQNYHTTLTKTLNDLRYSGNIPSLQDIHVELIRTGFRNVHAVFCLLPLAMMENSANAEMDVFLSENKAGKAFRQKIFRNPRYAPILKRDLLRFDLMGYLDPNFHFLSHSIRRGTSVSLRAPMRSHRCSQRFIMTDDCEIASHSISWRNAEFFNDVITEELHIPEGTFTIVDIHVSDANSKAAGFMSLMHRVTLNVMLRESGEIKTLSYVVKEKSGDVFGGEMVDEMKAFPKEIDVYSRFIPAFEEMWKKESVTFGPKMLKTSHSPFTVIVMEDLKSSGFHMKDCSRGLCLEDCEQVLAKMAKFHAVSVVYYENNGPYPDSFADGMFSENLIAQLELSYYIPILNSYIQSLEELGYSSQILESLHSYKGKIYTTVVEMLRLDSSKFNVLNHGDLWINNIQFADHDLIFVDYQVGFYGTPTFDLLYFITTSASLTVRTDKFDYLIGYYHSCLVRGLEALCAETTPPTLQELQDDIEANGFLMAVISVETLALMLAMPDIEMDIDLLSSETPEGVSFRRKIYTNDRFVQMMEKLVPFMWERGFIKPLEQVTSRSQKP
ncbi:uncharacterized protein LOC129774121 [Toxorhynchites rutilus septentrionalis]|uniref:uncharacterized protein LOC129774121 n=1 Tax=Toxorhynchites rutilus septentrionalis TaxID=329112 RepID=UPI002478B203|nr:uncharacterized protein LOC129774121 [Toxorhynchites rutilus septentrionalis]